MIFVILEIPEYLFFLRLSYSSSKKVRKDTRVNVLFCTDYEYKFSLDVFLLYFQGLFSYHREFHQKHMLCYSIVYDHG